MLIAFKIAFDISVAYANNCSVFICSIYVWFYVNPKLYQQIIDVRHNQLDNR